MSDIKYTRFKTEEESSLVINTFLKSMKMKLKIFQKRRSFVA
jgi:DNA-binding LytR/AlgR family response regulator